MRLISDIERQRDGSHVLCGNVACRVPLERPYLVVDLLIRNGGGFRSAICEKCRRAVTIGTRVEIDRETRYGEEV